MTRLRTIAVFFFFLFLAPSFGQIVINEFMSDNKTALPDIDGDNSDWLELYNNSDRTIVLSGYSLSDNPSNIDKWIIPDIIMPPYGYKLIFASGKNRTDSSELHTNFKIANNEESLFLADPLGEIIDQTIPADLNEDQSYARFPDGCEYWYPTENPTPGNLNYLIKNHLVFSDKSSFHTRPFYLKISSLNGDTVYYSFDGSIPKSDSAACKDSIYLDYTYDRQNVYSEIPTTPNQSEISYKAWEPPDHMLDKAIIVRCASYRKGIRTSEVYSQTYFIDSTVYEKYDIPIISLVTDSTNLFNSDSGIYVPGKHYDAGDPEWTGNYFQTGITWEKPVHIEYLKSNGELCFSQDAGIRIHGGKTRQAAQKSLKLYARNEYGKSNFNYRLLPQRSNKKYKRFLLRTTMGSWGGNTVIKDILAHEIVRNLNVEYQDYQPVVVYLNGEYWGIHTIRDKIDASYIAYTHEYDEDSIDLINGNYHMVASGSNKHYIDLAEYVEENDLFYAPYFDYVKSKIDINSFIDYQIAEMFISNWDWPGNNQRLWRPQTSNGRWRWIFFDLDAGFGNHNKNMFPRALKEDSDSSWQHLPVSTFLFRSFLNNQDFVNLFARRYEELLKEDFRTSNMVTKLNTIKKMYDNEMPHHIRRWNYPASMASWEDDIVDNLLTFIQERPCVVAENIPENLSLDNFGFNCNQVTNLHDSLTIAPIPNDGTFHLINTTETAYSGNLTITDISGQRVHIDNYFFLGEYGSGYINVNRLPAGIYVLTLQSPFYYFRKTFSILN